jgi:hypothetical protein
VAAYHWDGIGRHCIVAACGSIALWQHGAALDWGGIQLGRDGVAYHWDGMGRHGIEAAWDLCSRLGWDSLVAAWGGLGWNALAADLDGMP